MKKHQITNNDIVILSYIARCRVITASQLSAFTRRSEQVIRRRLRTYEANGLIVKGFREFGRHPGRPENLIFLTYPGFKVLKKHPRFAAFPDYDIEKTIHLNSVDHELLVNWCWIHLRQLETAIPDLSINFHIRSAPFHTKADKWYNLFPINIPADADLKDPITFIPDGLIVITKQDPHQTKKLLLFLEVDMGTEAIGTPGRKKTDVRQKILNYKRLFKTHHYRRFETIFKAKFNGFRLLFVTNTYEGLAQLCRLTQEMTPSEFIWLTNQRQMFEHGLGDFIWVRGGRQDAERGSVLGTKNAVKAPLQ